MYEVICSRRHLASWREVRVCNECWDVFEAMLDIATTAWSKAQGGQGWWENDTFYPDASTRPWVVIDVPDIELDGQKVKDRNESPPQLPA